MHESHHADTHELSFPEGAQLLEIVRVDGCGDEFGLFGGAHGSRLDVFEGCEICGALYQFMNDSVGAIRVCTFLLIDFLLDVKIDADDDQIRERVERANAHEDLGIVEGDLFRNLHHP